MPTRPRLWLPNTSVKFTAGNNFHFGDHAGAKLIEGASQPWTIECCFAWVTGAGSHSVFGKGDPFGTGGVIVQVHSATSTEVVWGSSSGTFALDLGITIVSGIPTYLAITGEGTSSLVSTFSAIGGRGLVVGATSANASTVPANTANLIIGNSTFNEEWTDRISFVRFWNRRLNFSELNRYYNEHLPRNWRGNLVFHWDASLDASPAVMRDNVLGIAATKTGTPTRGLPFLTLRHLNDPERNRWWAVTVTAGGDVNVAGSVATATATGGSAVPIVTVQASTATVSPAIAPVAIPNVIQIGSLATVTAVASNASVIISDTQIGDVAASTSAAGDAAPTVIPTVNAASSSSSAGTANPSVTIAGSVATVIATANAAIPVVLPTSNVATTSTSANMATPIVIVVSSVGAVTATAHTATPSTGGNVTVNASVATATATGNVANSSVTVTGSVTTSAVTSQTSIPTILPNISTGVVNATGIIANLFIAVAGSVTTNVASALISIPVVMPTSTSAIAVSTAISASLSYGATMAGATATATATARVATTFSSSATVAADPTLNDFAVTRVIATDSIVVQTTLTDIQLTRVTLTDQSSV